MKESKDQIIFKADPFRGGDLGNYWHYLFGFFIPATYWLWKNPDKWKGKKLLVDSCNPLTNALMKEYLESLSIPFEFEELTEKTIQMTRKDWKSIRGKIWRKFASLERSFRGEQSRWFTYHHLKLKKNTLLIPRWDKYLEQYGDFPLFFKNELSNYRTFILNQAKNSLKENPSPQDWLIIKRSPPPETLNQEDGKKARWFPGYGTERRGLTGIEEAMVQLNEQGQSVIALATGELGIFSQILAFAFCKSLIGVRGAEFANLFWMENGAKVYLYMSASFKNEPIQRKLAASLGLNYHEIPHEGAISPRLNIQKILQIEN